MRRAPRFAHSTQIRSGTTPTRISHAKIVQPMHSANPASSVAATTISPRQDPRDARLVEPNATTTAVTEMTAPIPCANRFGGPGTLRGATPRRARRRV